jgi:phage terminase large subunit GpA-like protein
MNQQNNVYREAFVEGLQPDPELTVAEWSNQYRIISQKGAAEPGPYRIERTPYLRKIAECLSPMSPYQEVIFMKSSQVGASELGFNWIGYIMHLCPGPVLMVQPNLDVAEKVSLQRIAPMLEDTPVLRQLVKKNSRDSANQKLLKEFRGGILIIAGANSAASLRSMPIRYLFMDELSSYPVDCGEGDPASLAEKRCQTFSARKKIFKNSTPLIKDTCRIEMEYLASDQQRYFVPCPHCGGLQFLKFANLIWERERPETAKYKCEHCKELIEEYHKTAMLEAGQWQPTASCSARKIGFHINALYSPLGWFSWADIATDFLKSSRDPALLQQFVNTVLGETFEIEAGAKMGASDLQSRAEDYELGTAPAGVLLAVGSVDVQDNRFEITVWGFGREEESWVLDHEVIHGNPALPEIWKQLEIKLSTPIVHATHAPLKLAAVAIDSGGHHTHDVYNFCRLHRAKNWFAVKGSNQRNQPAIGKPKKLDINLKGTVLKKGAELVMLGTDTIKSLLYGRLKLNEAGPGYIHFSQDLGPEFYEQLTSEKLVTRYVRGFPIKEWTKKSGQRNEALDLAVYGYAALQRVMSRYNRKTFWDQIEKSLVPKPETGPNNTQVEKNSAKNARISPQKRSGFVSRY